MYFNKKTVDMVVFIGLASMSYLRFKTNNISLSLKCLIGVEMSALSVLLLKINLPFTSNVMLIEEN